MAGTTSCVCVHRYLERERERENLLDSRNHAICWDQRELVYRPALQPSVGWGQGVEGREGNNFAGNYCDRYNNKFCLSSEREINCHKFPLTQRVPDPLDTSLDKKKKKIESWCLFLNALRFLTSHFKLSLTQFPHL